MEASTSPDNRKLLDLGLSSADPLSDLYNPETVEFPSSPSGLKNRPQEVMEPEAAPEATDLPADEDTDEESEEMSLRAIIDSYKVQLRKEYNSDADEYFEDFHSPFTYENNLSTRRSFIRRVKSTPLQVPDADRIEGIVKSGDLVRHGSIRRKIVPLAEDLTRNKAENPNTSTPLTDHKERLSLGPVFETPIANALEAEIDKSLGELGRLDEETILRIKDCLDGEKLKDIYTLGSRLQDLLSPTEIEEILNNSHKYADVFGEDVVLALSGSASLHNQPKKLLSAPKFDFESTTSDSADTPTSRPDLIRNSHSLRNDGSVSSAKKRLSAFEENQLSSSHQSESTSATPSGVWEGVVSEGLITPGEAEHNIVERMPKPDLIPELSADEELREERNWQSVVISGLEKKIDMKVIEPYKKVLSHGGYEGKGCQTAIIVFSACYLPDRNRNDYDYVMENLFLYVLTTLEQLVAEDYVLIYFHGATPKSCMPRFSWLKKSYQMVDRRLRKNLKKLYLVHPTLWLKAFVLMCKPFISAKFSRKLKYVSNLAALSSDLPLDDVCVPDRVKQLEFTMMIADLKRKKGIR